MRKAFATLILLLLTGMSLCAQNYHYLQVTELIIKGDNTMISFNTYLKIAISFELGRCEIDSKDPQIIDFEEMRSFISLDGYTVKECVATDTDYKDITFTMSVHPEKEKMFVEVSYSNISFVYVCHAIEPPKETT